MENIQGYEIEKSVLFENNRGFALGHNPAAPQPYVTAVSYTHLDVYKRQCPQRAIYAGRKRA